MWCVPVVLLKFVFAILGTAFGVVLDIDELVVWPSGISEVGNTSQCHVVKESPFSKFQPVIYIYIYIYILYI